MKYKVGDKVKIREDLVIGQGYGTCFITPNMHNLCGEIVHITEVNENRGEYRISPYLCWWTDEMFESVDTDEKKINKRVVIEVEGDKIVARCDNKLGEAYYHFNDNFYTCAKIALEQLEKAEKPYAWLKEGVAYYTPDICVKNLYSSHIYSANDADERFKEYGIAFRTEAEAIECAKKILYVIKQEG